MIFVGENSAVHDFEPVAFVRGNNSLVLPVHEVVRVLADASPQNVAIERRTQARRFTGQESSQVEGDFLCSGSVRWFRSEARKTDGLEIGRNSHGHISQEWRRRCSDGA